MLAGGHTRDIMDYRNPGLVVATEHTPLLPGALWDADHARRPRRQQQQQHGKKATAVTPLPDAVHVPRTYDGNTIVNLISAILLTSCSAAGFATIPMTRLVENAICHRYYNLMQSFDEPIDERQCKVDAIQSDVAFIFATLTTCEAIVGFLAAFPWGAAADR